MTDIANTSIRKIIHIDMDAFYASIEQRDFAEYRGKPIVVGGSSRRGVVAAASYEAREYGIHSAMPTQTALKRYPALLIARPRFDVYKKVSREIMEIFKTYTDLVEPLSLDEAFLDVTVNKFENPSATIIAQEIKKKIKFTTGLTASAGVSINKFLAKVASDMDKPDGLFVIKPEEAEKFISELPVAKFHGVGNVTAEKMHSRGIYTGKDLREMSRKELIRLFGKNGGYFYDISRGIDHRVVNPERIRKSFGKERTFEEDIDTLEGLNEVIQNITEMVWRDIEKYHIRGRTITLKIKYADFQQVTRSRSFTDYLESESQILNTALELMKAEFIEGNRIRLIGITLSKLENAEEQDEDSDHQLSFDF